MGEIQDNMTTGRSSGKTAEGLLRGALAADLLVTAIFAGALGTSLQMETLQGLVPSIFTSVTLAVMLALLAIRYMGGNADADVHEDVSPGIAGLWFVLYAAAIIAMGFYVATPVFVFLYLRLDAKVNVWYAALSTLAISAVLYAGFVKLLHIRPWVGAIPTFIDGFVGGGTTPPL